MRKAKILRCAQNDRICAQDGTKILRCAWKGTAVYGRTRYGADSSDIKRFREVTGMGLRPQRLEDAERVYEWINDRDTVQYLGYGFIKPRSLGEIREEIQLRLDGEFTGEYFTICDDVTEEYLGQCALILPDERAHTAEITIVLTSAARGRGEAGKALADLMEYAFRKKGYRRLTFRCLSANLPAIKLCERAGFVREGTLRGHMLTREGLCDVLLYGILKEEYESKTWKGGEALCSDI